MSFPKSAGVIVMAFRQSRIPEHAVNVDGCERPAAFDGLAVMPDPAGVVGSHGVSGVAPGAPPTVQPLVPVPDVRALSGPMPDLRD